MQQMDSGIFGEKGSQAFQSPPPSSRLPGLNKVRVLSRVDADTVLNYLSDHAEMENHTLLSMVSTAKEMSPLGQPKLEFLFQNSSVSNAQQSLSSLLESGASPGGFALLRNRKQLLFSTLDEWEFDELFSFFNRNSLELEGVMGPASLIKKIYDFPKSQRGKAMPYGPRQDIEAMNVSMGSLVDEESAQLLNTHWKSLGYQIELAQITELPLAEYHLKRFYLETQGGGRNSGTLSDKVRTDVCQKAILEGRLYSLKFENQWVSSAHLASDSKKTMVLENVYTLPAFRNKGLTSYFLNQVLRQGRDRGFTQGMVHLDARNRGLVSFYEKTGFYFGFQSTVVAKSY